MLVKRIHIEDFEEVDHFEASFDPQLAVLSPKIADTIVKAIGVIMKSEFLIGHDPVIKEGTEIKAEIEITGTLYYVTATGVPETNSFEYDVKTQGESSCDDFYDMIHQNAEEESLSRFVYDRRNRFSDRLKHYKDIEDYYPERSFSKLTDGIGDTRMFRISLKNHGKVNFDRDILSLSDAVIYEFLSFIHLNRFWQNIESIRDFNHIFWPLFVFDLTERTDEAEQLAVAEYLKNAVSSLERQIFLSGHIEQKEYTIHKECARDKPVDRTTTCLTR